MYRQRVFSWPFDNSLQGKETQAKSGRTMSRHFTVRKLSYGPCFEKPDSIGLKSEKPSPPKASLGASSHPVSLISVNCGRPLWNPWKYISVKSSAKESWCIKNWRLMTQIELRLNSRPLIPSTGEVVLILDTALLRTADGRWERWAWPILDEAVVWEYQLFAPNIASMCDQ